MPNIFHLTRAYLKTSLLKTTLKVLLQNAGVLAGSHVLPSSQRPKGQQRDIAKEILLPDHLRPRICPPRCRQVVIRVHVLLSAKTKHFSCPITVRPLDPDRHNFEVCLRCFWEAWRRRLCNCFIRFDKKNETFVSDLVPLFTAGLLMWTVLGCKTVLKKTNISELKDEKKKKGGKS